MPSLSAPFQSRCVFLLEAFSKGQEIAKGPVDCAERQRVDLLAAGEVFQPRIEQFLWLLTIFAVSPRVVNRSRERTPCTERLWDQTCLEMMGPHSGVQVVEASPLCS